MEKTFKYLITLLFLLSITSCAEFLQRRTFVDEMDKETDGFFVAGRDFEFTPGDSGEAYRSRKEIRDRTPASKRVMRRRLNDRSIEKELRRRENSLTPREFAAYQKRKVYLDGTSEKNYYLQLSRSEREEFLASKMVRKTRRGETLYDDSPFNLVTDHRRAQKNISLGMNKDDIKRNWGSPSRVDIAGNPRNENERWTFYDGRRVQKIFFENGVVGGWASE